MFLSTRVAGMYIPSPGSLGPGKTVATNKERIYRGPQMEGSCSSVRSPTSRKGSEKGGAFACLTAVGVPS